MSTQHPAYNVLCALSERAAGIDEPDTTVYAVCQDCAHIEPRPERALQDWADCENCRGARPMLFTDGDAAEDASEELIAAAAPSTEGEPT